MTRAWRLLLTAALAVAGPVAALAQEAVPIPAEQPGDHLLGSPDAAIVLTVYLSPISGRSADWYLGDFPAIRAKYVDSGLVRVAFRELVTPPGDLATAGILVARCAASDRYFAVLDALMENLSLLESDPTGSAWLTKGVDASGLRPQQIRDCLSESTQRAEVAAEGAQASAGEMTGAPGFLVNGEPAVPGPHRDLTTFDAVFQPLMASR